MCIMGEFQLDQDYLAKKPVGRERREPFLRTFADLSYGA